jgi:hypothetical protein
MVFFDKGLNVGPFVTQTKVWAVPRIQYGIIRPGQDNIAKGIQGRLEIFGRPGSAGAAFKNGVADDNPIIAFNHKTDLILDMSRGVKNSQQVIANFHSITGV